MNSLYGFVYSRARVALDYLGTIALKLRKQILKKVEVLAKTPFPPGHKLIKSASAGEENVYRLRSGDYRILYTVRSNPNHIVVLDIDHRKDVYR